MRSINLSLKKKLYGKVARSFVMCRARTNWMLPEQSGQDGQDEKKYHAEWLLKKEELQNGEKSFIFFYLLI